MLNPSLIHDLARQLQTARATQIQLRQLSKAQPEATLTSAYAIQHAWLQIELNKGRSVKGRKIGLTSKALQQTFKATELLTLR